MGNDITYINPTGGLNFFDRQKYMNNNIQIYFQKISLGPYTQNRNSFEAGLSIIDVMMFNKVEDINLMLDKFELL